MQRYRCHKEVSAAKIVDIVRSVNKTTLYLTSGIVVVNLDWHAKHSPQVGGYYVVYNDNYASYSPAEAFEQGYTAI